MGNLYLRKFDNSNSNYNSNNNSTIIDDYENDEDEIFDIFKDNSDRLYALTNIESADYLDKLTPIVHESLLERKSLDELISSLDIISNEKSKNLEAICKQSESDILNSVNNISSIKTKSNDILTKVREISSILEESGSSLIEKKKDFLTLKNNSTRINQSIEYITASLQILELTNKVHDFIVAEKYFIALKHINELKKANQKNYEINQFKFANQIYQSIPAMTNLIKQKSFEKVRLLLGNFDKNVTTVGEILFTHTEQQMNKWADKINHNDLIKEYSLNSPIELTMRLVELSAKFNPLENDYVHIPLNPLYDAILIYETIDELDELKSLFIKEITFRKARIFQQLIKLNSGKLDGIFSDLSGIQEFLYKMASFFVIDAIINAKTRYKLKSWQKIVSIWNVLLDKLILVLTSFIKAITNDEVDQIVELKKMVGIFIKIMEGYNFPAKRLYDDILVLLFKKYQELLSNNFEDEFKVSLYEDDSMPMRINDATLYKKVLAVSWYQTDNEEIIPISPVKFLDENDRDFPKHLPFSQLYPMTCAQIRSFVRKSLQFLDFNFYNHNFKLLSQLLITSLDDLMSGRIGKHLKEKVNSTNREEIAQNLINLDFFYISSNEVSKLLTYGNANQLSKISINVNLVKSLPQKNFRLNSINIFKEIKKTAESKLFEMVDDKVIQLLEMVDFDFATTIVNKEPSMYVVELGEFLKAMFSSTFSNLPSQVLELLISRIFDILAEQFKDFLLISSTITDVAILNFDNDLTYLEEILTHLRSNNSDQFNKKMESKFDELRQVILLIKNRSFEEFRNFKNEKYSKIDTSFGILLLNKTRINGMTVRDIEERSKLR